MLTVDPKEIHFSKLHAYLQGAVAPRPIAFASTISGSGQVNLSPFSFFNIFSSNPPILVFSPSRRGRDASVKHTYENIKEVPEVVINVVNFPIVEQASLTSCEFPKGVNEFIKAGFTEVKSEKIKPPRVGESPIAMECKVNQVIDLGTGGGAGSLVLCEVVLMHIKEEIIDEHGHINPYKLDAVARLGGDYYVRASGDALFEVPKPNRNIGIGFDNIPERIRQSSILTGNDLGRLANVEALPLPELVDKFSENKEVQVAVSEGETAVHKLAQSFLREGKTEEAWMVLLGK